MTTIAFFLTATIGRPETLHRCSAPRLTGSFFGEVTYLITGIPAAVPFAQVLDIARRVLTCRSSPFANYRLPWAKLIVADSC